MGLSVDLRGFGGDGESLRGDGSSPCSELVQALCGRQQAAAL